MRFPLSLHTRQLGPLLLVLAGAVAAFAGYIQALDYPFVSDDRVYVLENAKLSGLGLSEIWRLFTEPYNAFYEFLPLRDFSYWFDMTLFGLSPSAFRIHNILLYLVCVPLVYAVSLEVWRYFRPEDRASAPWAAAIIAALFALNPSHAEAVVWISGRKDVLSGMFSLLAVWLTLSSRSENGLSVPYAVTALIALLAAMLSKATAVAVAPVMALIWLLYWWDLPVLKRQRRLLFFPLASLLLALSVTLYFSSLIKTKMPFYFGWEAVTRSLAALGWLARLSLTPETRHYFYPVFEDPYLPVMTFLGAAIIVATGVGAIKLLRKRTLEGFSVVVFFLICLPNIQLVPYCPPSLVSDRFVFLAAWPTILLIVSLSWRLKQMVRITVLLIIAAAWCFQNVERPRDWSSIDSMLDKEAQAYPGYFMPLFQKVTGQMRYGLYQEAIDTAKLISDRNVKNLTTNMIMASYVVNIEAENARGAEEAIGALRNYGVALMQPPVQLKWDPAMVNVWRYSQDIYMKKWRRLLMIFPDDALVLQSAEQWMRHGMGDH